MLSTSFANLSTSLYLAAAKPTLGDTKVWFTGEMKTALGIIVLALCCYFIFKQKIGMMVSTVVVGAFIWFLASDPAVIFESIGNLFKPIFGG